MRRDRCGESGPVVSGAVCASPQSEPGAGESDRKTFRLGGSSARRLFVLSITVAVLVLGVAAGRAAAEPTVIPSSAMAVETPKPAQQSTMDLQWVQRILRIEQDAIHLAAQQTEQMQSVLDSIRRQEQLQRSLDSALRSQQQMQSILDSIQRQEQLQRGLDSALRSQQQMQSVLDSIRRQEQLQRGLDSALRSQQQMQSVLDSVRRQEQLQRILDSAAWSQQQVQSWSPPPVYNPAPIHASPPVYNPPMPVYSPPPVYNPAPIHASPPVYNPPPMPVYSPPPVYNPPGIP